jgi:hypothetical protein
VVSTHPDKNGWDFRVKEQYPEDEIRKVKKSVSDEVCFGEFDGPRFDRPQFEACHKTKADKYTKDNNVNGEKNLPRHSTGAQKQRYCVYDNSINPTGWADYCKHDAEDEQPAAYGSTYKRLNFLRLRFFV